MWTRCPHPNSENLPLRESGGRITAHGGNSKRGYVRSLSVAASRALLPVAVHGGGGARLHGPPAALGTPSALCGRCRSQMFIPSFSPRVTGSPQWSVRPSGRPCRSPGTSEAARALAPYGAEAWVRISEMELGKRNLKGIADRTGNSHRSIGSIKLVGQVLGVSADLPTKKRAPERAPGL